MIYYKYLIFWMLRCSHLCWLIHSNKFLVNRSLAPMAATTAIDAHEHPGPPDSIPSNQERSGQHTSVTHDPPAVVAQASGIASGTSKVFPLNSPFSISCPGHGNTLPQHCSSVAAATIHYGILNLENTNSPKILARAWAPPLRLKKQRWKTMRKEIRDQC
jgi:hypothetical protein